MDCWLVGWMGWLVGLLVVDYTHFLFLRIYERNRKHFPAFPLSYIQTLLDQVWRTVNTNCNFSFSQISSLDSITLWKRGECFLLI